MNIENKKIVFKIKIPNLSGNEEIEEISILEIKLKKYLQCEEDYSQIQLECITWAVEISRSINKNVD